MKLVRSIGVLLAVALGAAACRPAPRPDRATQQLLLAALRQTLGEALRRILRQNLQRFLQNNAAHAAVPVGKVGRGSGDLHAPLQHGADRIALQPVKGGVEHRAGADDAVAELIGDHAEGPPVVGQDDQLDIHILELVGHGHAVARVGGKELRVHHIGRDARVDGALHGIGVPLGADDRHQLQIRYLVEIDGVQDGLQLGALPGCENRRSHHCFLLNPLV